MQEHGYVRRDNTGRFPLERAVLAVDDRPDIAVDFPVPGDVEFTRITQSLISRFAMQRADDADLALRC